MIRVAVEAGSAIDRAGLESVLRAAGFQIVDPAQAEALVTIGEFDEDTSSSPVPVVLVADDRPPLAEAVQSGVRALLPRDASPAEIEAAVRAAAAGLMALRPEDLSSSTRPVSDNGAALTPREIEVLRMIAEGLPNKTIAWNLGISEHTVKFHVASILSRLGAASRAEAVAIGIRRGLILL